MNPGLVQCIVESLRVAGPIEERRACLVKFNLKDWQRTLPWLDDSGLALRLLDRLSHSNPRNALPQVIQTRLRRNLASNRRRVAEMKKEFHSLNLRFEEAGIKYAVLKGFALIPGFCPEAALRVQYDYDYLVRPDSVITAQKIVGAAGYSQNVKSPGYEPSGVTSFVAEPLSLPAPDADFYNADIPRDVEVHLDLWQSERDMINLEVPQNALDRTRKANWEGLSFPVLAEDDALLFQVLHTFQHILTYWCRLSSFLEIAYFIERRRSDAAFWEQFRSRISGHRHLPEIVALVFAMAETLFGAPVPAQVRIWMAPNLPRALSLWVQRYGRNWALARFPGSKLSLLVHREFIEDPVAWRAVAWSRLFPFHRPAHVVEPVKRSLASYWKAKWQQCCFVLRRLQFHLRALLSLGWELLCLNRIR